ncbi:MAG TPA: hypothetical protein PK280_19815, partial [Planctomycetota bacterium]|nr:hypothetical protein [Planctomycetota bacterium]
MIREKVGLSAALAAILGLAWAVAPAAGQEGKPAPGETPSAAPVKPTAPPPVKPAAKPSAGPAAPAADLSEMTPEEAARMRQELKVATDRIMVDARRFMQMADYDRCIERCERALRLDGSCLEAQKLKHQAEKAKIDFRAKMLEQESTTKDKEAIADLDEASNYPDRKGPLPRPVNAPKPSPLPLRIGGSVVKSEKMLAMEQKLNQRVDINFVDADLDFVMATLFRITGVNIIADQNALQGKRLTLHVENMPLKEILRFIVRNNSGVNYTVTEDAVWVSAGGDNPGLEPRVHALNVGLVRSNPIPQMQQQRPQGGNNGGGAQLPGVPQIPGQQPGQGQGQNGQQQETTYLEDVINWMKKWKEWPAGSEWAIDKMSSGLMVYTTPEMHEKIAEMLEMMDRPPIQVLIGTRFITISDEHLLDLGLDFGANSKPGQDVELSSGSGTSLGTSSIAGGLTAIIKGNNTDPLFTATLKALETKGKGKLLSAPQIITLNNQMGQFHQNTTFEAQTDWREITVTDATGNGSITSNVKYLVPVTSPYTVGFDLYVTPSVGRDLKHIILELQPVISEVAGGVQRFETLQVLQVDDSEPPPPVQKPVTETKTLSTRMVVNDGDLLIIGGLMSQD